MTVFGSDNDAIVYYLAGTSGWILGSPFAGRPALLWNPVIEIGDGSFGVRSNQFAFTVTGTANISVVVQACNDLSNPVWTAVWTGTLTNGSLNFSEAVESNGTGRFYRITAP
jgi:hypothetical protein